MEIENWFYTPIYYHHFEEPVLSKCLDEIRASYELTKNEELNSPWEDTVKTTFSYSKENDFLSQAPILRQEILNNAAAFASSLDLEFKDLVLKESWINITSKGGFQHYHNHIPYDISGVFYYQTNGEDGNIVFKDPAQIKSTSVLLKKLPRTVRYAPRVGTLVLFPSFLEHCVFHNETDSNRISIALNINIEL